MTGRTSASAIQADVLRGEMRHRQLHLDSILLGVVRSFLLQSAVLCCAVAVLTINWAASHTSMARTIKQKDFTLTAHCGESVMNVRHLDAGNAAADFLRSHGREHSNMLMWALTLLPPGAEDLALRALSCLLVHSGFTGLHTLATEQVTALLSGKSSLAEAALREAAWWQQVMSLTDL